jgi:hypothetical protein
MIKLRDENTAVTDGVDHIHKIREEVSVAAKQAQGPRVCGVQEAADKLEGALTGIEDHLVRSSIAAAE